VTSPAGPTFDDVRAAAARIAALVPPTPVLRSAAIDAWVGTRVHLKAEHLHATGAFKLRGATNAVLLLSDEDAARGVVAHSSGNHASALALAAQRRGIACTVVMPRGVPATKRAATEAAGAAVVICDPTLEARAATVAALVADTGAVEIHPFDDPRVQAGQGTATLELLEAVPAIGMVVAPVSGGGLLSGTAVAAHGIEPSLPVWGAEPAGADDAFRSLAAGHLVLDGPTETIADGLVAQLSERTLAILQAHAVRVVTVTEDQIVEGMRRLAVDAKQVVEPSGAVALAGLAQLAAGGADLAADVGVIVSGGNVDLSYWSQLVLTSWGSR
jgi:threonine dehydratase